MTPSSHRTPGQTSTALRIILAVFIAFFPIAPPASAAFESPQKTTAMRTATHAKDAPVIGNYDVRDDESKHGREVVERYRGKAGKDRKEQINEKKEKIQAAKEKLGREVPGLEVAMSAHTGAPEIVGIGRGRQKLTGPSNQPRENIARGFLQRNADLYGLSQREVAQMKKQSDYQNLAGNLGWVEYKQEVNGLPVFRGELRLALNADGEIVRTTGNLVPALEDFPTGAGKTGIVPEVSASDAVVAAATSIGVAIPGGSLTLKEVSADGTTWIFAPGPFADDVKVALEYFPLDSGILTLAWSMILWQENAAYYTYVGAEGGELLWRKNIVDEQVQPATYVVYDADSPAPASPTPALPGSVYQAPAIARTPLTRVHEHALNNLGWMPDGASITTGNNVDSGLDLVSPNGIDAGSRATGTAFRVFDYNYNPGPGLPGPVDAPTTAAYRGGEVAHMFFWSNRYHDRLYDLGFTEAARNFQHDNFGRGGLGNDRVLAEGQDFSGTNNANFATPPDGSSGRMQMYIFTGPTPDRTSALDQDILIHELTHGTSNRLHANASGLATTMAGGMGEGWSDFYARVLTSGPDEDPNGIYAAGGYSTQLIVSGFQDNYYYGIRRFPYAVRSTVGPNGRPHNPLTFADLDSSQINLTDGAFPRGPIGSGTALQVHNVGEIWASALFEVRARMINRLGWATGNQLSLQLVTDGMKLDPASPTLLQGRDSILAANAASATGTGETELDIWRGFATRGMGFSARVISAASGSVVEAFDLPNAAIGDATVSNDSCDNGGVADPGETLTLTIPITNPFQLNAINNVIVQIGGATISLGTIAPGATVIASATLTIPGSAACGVPYSVPVVITSDFGTSSRTIELPVGLATSQVPEGTFSSGDVAVPILDLQTAEVQIPVSAVGAVGDVNVSVRLNHTFDGDLVITLVAPDGTPVVLSSNRGGSGDNFGTGTNDCGGVGTVFDDAAPGTIAAGVAPFNGSFRPDSPLSAMRGRSMNGTWRLQVRDTANIDTGTLGCVKLEFSRQLYFCCGVSGTPIVQAAPPATLVTECASAANGAPDPGEVVTMSFPLKNVGSGLTTDLVATLRTGGGITSLGGPQTYGVLSPVGAAVARPFQFSVDSSAACGSDVTATFDLTDGGASLGSVSFAIRVGATVSNTYTFANAAAIKIPATGTGASTGAPSNPYPSAIVVSGVSGTVVSTRMTIKGFSHTFPGDVDMLLVGPGGQKFIPFSDLGGATDAVNLTIALEDAAAAVPPTILVSGTFRPSNSGANDPFPAPAPAAPYQNAAPGGAATFASVFGGASPNGSWNLHVVDDAGADIGSIANGWELTFVTADPSCAIVNAPQITTPTVSQSALWPPNHTMRDVAVNYTTGTDCAICSLSVSSNEAVNGTGDGDTSPDWEVVDAHNVRLRAERAGNGTGRIYTITITCSNGAGTSTQTVAVYVAHDIGSPKAGAAFRINTPVDFAGTFWDDPARRHTATWKFDDLSAAGAVTEPTGSRLGSVRGGYTFAEAGVYRVSMNVTDDHNVTSSISNAGDNEAIVIVYDPNGGYVLGGGWYQSAAGRLTFGYNSKYHANGRNVKGEAQMSFAAGTMQFDANKIDYLTIAGARAQVGGQGSLNSDGPYLFLMSMIDGQAEGGGGVDRVRVKIWHKVTGQVAYDSQPGASDAADPTTTVGDGSSVVIQK